MEPNKLFIADEPCRLAHIGGTILFADAVPPVPLLEHFCFRCIPVYSKRYRDRKMLIDSLLVSFSFMSLIINSNLTWGGNGYKKSEL